MTPLSAINKLKIYFVFQFEDHHLVMFKTDDFAKHKQEKSANNMDNKQQGLLSELETAVARRKTNMASILDSDSDDDLLEFLKKDTPKTMVSSDTPKVKASALLSSDDDYSTDSIASDYSDGFQDDGNSDTEISVKSFHKTVPPVAAARSVNSTKSPKASARSTSSKPESLKSVKSIKSEDTGIAGLIKTNDSEKPVSSVPKIESPPSALETAIIEHKLEETDVRSINAVFNPIENKIDTVRTEELTANPVSIQAKKIEETISPSTLMDVITEKISDTQKSSNIARKDGSAGNKTLISKKMQTLIINRRKGKNSKLPENYTGLGSTLGLEELDRFRNNALNTELQGAKGQRKEMYLAWLEKKESLNAAKATVAKQSNQEKKKIEQEQLEEKQKIRELTWNAWQSRKKELAIGKNKHNKDG